jgi:uncharacterized spore protein YtfJ
MNAQEILGQTRDMLTVKRVFGDPYERDGVLLVPVARVRGGGGGGGGEGGPPGAETSGKGWGGGFGMAAEPVGVYVVRDGDVKWRPSVDVNRLIQLAGVALLIVLRSFLRRRKAR